ncbi:hypothetical protein NDA11_002489 [Ustilago hordei]|nr:hypothetical protein NDA11_002489 [Ustilago hordei]
MQDEDACRICRSGPEPNSPLYYPCKCTGSIRYCHQDCLLEWLQHSRKKYCELCKHPFIFHKKYRKDMPADGNLPRYLYLRRLLIRSVQASQLVARGLLLAFTWLGLLPWINVNVWRFMFWAIDVVTWMGEPPFEMAAPPPNASAGAIASNASKPVAEREGNVGRTRSGAGAVGNSPINMEATKSAVPAFVQKLANDCFQGQVLTCHIVLFFVGAFLLREWILQNIPQNFDVGAAVQPAPVPLAVAQPRDPREQMMEDLNHERVQLEDFLPRAQAEQQMATQQQVRGNQEQEPEADERPELQLDPEMQREQARHARIRRLEQMLASAASEEQADKTEEELALAPASGWSRGDHDSAETVLAEPSAERSSSPAQQSWSAQANVPETLGWSEQSNGIQDTDQDDRQAQADSDASHFELTDAKDTAKMEESSSSTPAEPSASTSNAVQDAQTTDTTGADQPLSVAQPAPEVDNPAPSQANAAAAEIADDQDAWEDESDPEADAAPRDDMALRAAAAAVFPPPIAHIAADHDDDHDDIIEINAAGVAANAAADPDNPDDPDAEVGLAEEMDGILEAIGMRGPIFGIVQNLFLMIFLCGFVMLAFVMAPYVVGRALGSGLGLVRVLAMPVKLLRYVTDPLFDRVIAVGANKVWPRIAGLVGMQSQGEVAVVQAATAGANGWLQKVLPSMLVAKNARQVIAEQAASATRGSATAAMLVRLLPASVTTSSHWKSVSDSFDIALSAGFQGTLHRILDSIIDSFARLDAHRNGTTTTDRIFCVAFGHFYWLLILFIHQHFSKPDLQRAMAQESALKLYIDQHVLILKALSFIFIELVIFPLGCGLLFDICTLPFLAEASVLGWPEKVRTAPLSFAFTRWMGGTIYMFVFAQYVSATRRVLRPGVLCWIRDPNDPSFHPIKEILDKKSWTQLRKIAASAVMYSATLVASIGVNTYAMRYLLGGLRWLPLRWKPWGVGVEVPVDLLIAHFVVPWLTGKMDPEKTAEKVMDVWWETMARGFRLSSYLVGGEYLDERKVRRGAGCVQGVKDAWGRMVDFGVKREAAGEGEWVEDGGLCRVPADDKAITTGPLIIPLDAEGNAVTEKLAEAITNQETDAEKHTPKPTYTNIYLPSHYRARIAAVLTLLWLSHSALFILGIGVPLSLGRGIAAMVKGREGAKEVHDFYSFTIGFTLLMTTVRLVKGARKMWLRRIRRARMHRTTPTVYIALHLMVKVKRVLKAFFLLVGLAGMVPLIVGLLIDQYVVVPFRYKSTQLPVLALGQIWALGIIEMRLLFSIVNLLGRPHPANRNRGPIGLFIAAMNYVVAGGLYPRPRVRVAWTRIVLPLASVGVVLLLGPIGVAGLLAEKGWVKVASGEEEQLLLRNVYGVVQSIVLLIAVRAGVRKRMDSWTELLKDEVFLESTELKNYEEKEESPINAAAEATLVDRSADEYAAEGTLPDVMFR